MQDFDQDMAFESKRCFFPIEQNFIWKITFLWIKELKPSVFVLEKVLMLRAKYYLLDLVSEPFTDRFINPLLI